MAAATSSICCDCCWLWRWLSPAISPSECEALSRLSAVCTDCPITERSLLVNPLKWRLTAASSSRQRLSRLWVRSASPLAMFSIALTTCASGEAMLRAISRISALSSRAIVITMTKA
ncbi:hypothetical protein D3C76_1400000 [compost metagenome]